MTTTEHLDKILAKIDRLLAFYAGKKFPAIPDSLVCGAEAGWRATKAVIETLRAIPFLETTDHTMINDILSSWPVELLD